MKGLLLSGGVTGGIKLKSFLNNYFKYMTALKV